MNRIAPSRAAQTPIEATLFFTDRADTPGKNLLDLTRILGPRDRLRGVRTGLTWPRPLDPDFENSWFRNCTGCRTVRGVVFAPGGVRNVTRNGVIGAGWRRASRLTGRNALLDAPRPATPLFHGAEEATAMETLDSGVPPEQPPSSPDSLAELRPGLSVFDPDVLCLTLPLTAHASAATSGCEASPNGLAR